VYSPDQFQRLTLAQYRRMLELGILTPADQVELLEGLLVQRQAQPTGTAIALAIRKWLGTQSLASWSVHTSCPIPLSGYEPESQPEPDLVVARRSPDHDTTIRAAEDVGLVIEIGGPHPDLERVGMAGIYARASIPVYWVVVVPEKVIEVYTSPSGPIDSPHYAKRDRYPVGTAVPVVLDGNTVGTIPVAEVMS
jgi:hypothetical protein